MRKQLAVMTLMALVSLARAQDATTQPDPFEKAVDQALAEATAKFQGDANVLVRRGVLADRAAGTVTISARFTGVGTGETVEFFLVGPDSAKDYESLAVSAAKASDVHAGLAFVGLEPGRPVNYRESRLWPKGERVEMSFAWDVPVEDEKIKAGAVRMNAEELMVDPRTEKPLAVEGFMFVGSVRVQSKEGGPPDTYLADVSEARSIVSNYNEPGTVLDVPGQAVQGAVYGFRKISPAVKFSAGQSVTVTLKPMPMKDGSRRVSELKLTVEPMADRAGKAFQYILSDEAGKRLSDRTAASALAAIGSLVEAGHDVFVTVTPSDDMTLADVRRLYGLFDAAQGAKGLRVEPARAGHLFWRAFFPQEEWRDAQSRLGEPWELHLRANADAAMLRQFSYNDDQELKTKDFTFKDPDELAKILKEQSGRWTDGVFVFAPAEMTYGRLMSVIRPGLSNVNWWYVFPPVATTQPVQIP